MSYHEMRETLMDSRWDAMRDEYEPTRYCEPHRDPQCYSCVECEQCGRLDALDFNRCCAACAQTWCEVCQATDCRLYGEEFQNMERHWVGFRTNPPAVPAWGSVNKAQWEAIARKLTALGQRVNAYAVTPSNVDDFIRLESAYNRLSRYAGALWR